METKLICPLGNICEEIKNNQLIRCRWYINVKGKDPQSEQFIDRWDCTLVWMVITNVEIAQTNRGQTQAIESLRNEMIKEQQDLNLILFEAAKKRGLIEG